MNLKKLFSKWDEMPDLPFNFTGIWRNEQNSEMTIHTDEKGNLSGSYASAAESGVRSTHALTGFVNGDLIGFTVDFGRGHMVCCWTGHAVSEFGSESIVTQWNLVKRLDGEDFALETWGATHCGSNIFKRIG